MKRWLDILRSLAPVPLLETPERPQGTRKTTSYIVIKFYYSFLSPFLLILNIDNIDKNTTFFIPFFITPFVHAITNLKNEEFSR
jgi:hypothetical protein